MSPSKELAVASSAVASPVNPQQTLKASTALLAHIKKAAKQDAAESSKRNLLDDADSDSEAATAAAEETPIWLTLTTKRHIVDKTRLQPGKIVLPHSLSSDEASTICLITADPQRAYKNIVASEAFPAALRARITRVIDFTKLKAKYSQYEAQRKLFAEHDVFLGDDRIINRLPKVLGKTFFKSTQKRPIPVVLRPKAPKIDGKRATRAHKKEKAAKAAEGAEPNVNAASPATIAKEVEKALSSALVHLSPSTNTAVRVGWSAWTPQQIAENVDAVAAALVEKWVPQKWRNVRGIYIKGPETAALPIWMTDELWLDEKDVKAITAEDEDEDEAKAIESKPEAGKKRKAAAKDVDEAEPAAAPKKKSKKQPVESEDTKLDKQIAERKQKLKKQKAAAKKAMDE
jgi:ribosome biogenesis protein UTP30